MRKIIKNKDGGVILYIKSKGDYSAVRVGFYSGHNNNTKNGLAHLSEHVWFMGSENIPFETINHTQEKIIPNLNAYTSSIKTYFTFSRTNRLLEKGLSFVSELMFHNHVNEKQFEKEKGVIAEEFFDNYDRESKAVDWQEDVITHKDFKLLARNRLGSPEDLKNISVEDVLKFRQDEYTRNNFFFAIATKLPLWKIKKLVDKYFYENLPRQDSVEYGADKIKCDVFDGRPCLKVVNEPNSNQIQLRISFKMNEGYTKNIYSYMFDYFMHYFSSPNGILYTNLRKKGLVYSSSFGRIFNKEDGLMGTDIKTTKEKLPAVLKEINRTFKDIYQNNFDRNVYASIQDNYINSEDEKFLNYNNNSIVDRYLRQYERYGEFIKFPKKKRLRFIKAVKYEDLLPKFTSIINKENKPYITIVGNVNENELPSYEEMTKTLLSGLENKELQK